MNGSKLKFSILTLLAVVFAAVAHEQGFTHKLISAKVAAQLKHHFPGCQVTDVDEDREDGEKIVRIRLEDEPEKQNILAKVSMDGEILELDEDMDYDHLPRRVQQAFRRAFPKADVKHVEKGTKMEVTYRIDMTQNGRGHEVKITRRGRIFEVESRD